MNTIMKTQIFEYAMQSESVRERNEMVEGRFENVSL